MPARAPKPAPKPTRKNYQVYTTGTFFSVDAAGFKEDGEKTITFFEPDGEVIITFNRAHWVATLEKPHPPAPSPAPPVE